MEVKKIFFPNQSCRVSGTTSLQTCLHHGTAASPGTGKPVAQRIWPLFSHEFDRAGSQLQAVHRHTGRGLEALHHLEAYADVQGLQS